MIPDPLHPAIVHFPIVLLLLGAPLAVASVFIRGHRLPLLAAVVLSLGACSAIVAVVTGNQDEELAGELGNAGERILEEHEEWGERVRNAGLIAAVLAIASALLARFPAPARVVGTLAAVAAIAAAWSVVRAGHYGGLVVYRVGVGVNTSAKLPGAPADPLRQGGGHERPGDDD